MVQGSVTGPQLPARRLLDRVVHEGLGGDERVRAASGTRARPAATAAAKLQPDPWVFRGVDARRGQLGEVVDAHTTSTDWSPAGPSPPVMTTTRRAEGRRGAAAARRGRRGCAAARRGARPPRGTFGVARPRRRRSGSRYSASASGVEEPVAGRGDHHRVDDEVREADRRPRDRRPRRPSRCVASSPVFTAAHVKSSSTASDLGDDERGVDGLHAADRGGVLRGQRGDRATCRTRPARRRSSGRPGRRPRRPSPTRRW